MPESVLEPLLRESMLEARERRGANGLAPFCMPGEPPRIVRAHGSLLVRAPHDKDYLPTRWPQSPRIVVKCDP